LAVTSTAVSPQESLTPLRGQATGVLALIDGWDRVITEDGELLRELILDAERDGQPTAGADLERCARHVGTSSRDITWRPGQDSNLRPRD
jgi:hypothetical protein